MIPVAGRGDQPDPRDVVHRDIEEGPLRVPGLLARFGLLVALVFLAVGALPDLARLFLDPLHGRPELAPARFDAAYASEILWVAVGIPAGLLLMSWAAAALQPLFAFRGRRLAFRKQGWALYTEFGREMEASLEEGETPRGYKVAHPPELATSLLLRLAFAGLVLALALLAVTTALALRIHWPARGQEVWYLLTSGLTALGLATLVTVRTPPMVRLLIQGAVPALHLGHGLMLWTTPVPPWGLPALVPDLLLGGLGGYAAYRIGQRERGARFYLVTDAGLLAFDTAGRRTRLLGTRRPVRHVRTWQTPSGYGADFLPSAEERAEDAPGAAEFLDVRFEDPAPIREMAEALGATVEEVARPPRGWAALTEPGLAGWALLAALALACGLASHHLLRAQALLEVELLRHVPTWFAGDPRPLHAGSLRSLEVDPDFHPARVFHALTLFDTGRYPEARRALEALPPDDALRGFAARVVPRYRRYLSRLQPGLPPVARAIQLAETAPGPHAARRVLELMAEEPQDRGRDQAFAEALACLRLQERPEAAYSLPESTPEALRARAGRAAATLDPADPARALVDAWLHLLEGDDRAAAEAARGHGALAGLGGPEGLRLTRALLARMIGLAQEDPARWRAPAREFHREAMEALGGDAAHPGLAFAAAALEAGDEARARTAALEERFPETNDLFRVLAEEAAGDHSRAEFFAYHLVGLDVARGIPPPRIPALAPLGPAHGYYVAALALRGLGEPARAAVAFERALAEEGFLWGAFARDRGLDPEDRHRR